MSPTFEQIRAAIAEAAAGGRPVAIAPDAVRTLHQHLQQHADTDPGSEWAVRWLALAGIEPDIEACEDEDDARDVHGRYSARTEVVRRDVRRGPWVRVVDEQQQTRDHHPAGTTAHTPDTEGAQA